MIAVVLPFCMLFVDVTIDIYILLGFVICIPWYRPQNNFHYTRVSVVTRYVSIYLTAPRSFTLQANLPPIGVGSRALPRSRKGWSQQSGPYKAHK
jgi:hypothetical protein